MSDAALPAHAERAATQARARRFDRRRCKRGVLWLFVACGASAAIEPSPYEFMFLVAALTLRAARTACSTASMIPLIVGLAVFNAGGLLALTPFVDERESVHVHRHLRLYRGRRRSSSPRWSPRAPLTSALRTIRSGYVAAGVFAATLGILGYFNVARPRPAFHALRRRAPPALQRPQRVRPVPCAADRLADAGSPVEAQRGLRCAPSSRCSCWGSASAELLARRLGRSGSARPSLMVALTFLTSASAALAAAHRRHERAGRVRGRDPADDRCCRSRRSARCSSSARRSSNITTLGEIGPLRQSGALDPDVAGAAVRLRPAAVPQHLPGEDPHEMYVNAFASYGWLGGLEFLRLHRHDGLSRLAARLPALAGAEPCDRDLVLPVSADGAGLADRLRSLAPSLSDVRQPLRPRRQRAALGVSRQGRRSSLRGAQRRSNPCLRSNRRRRWIASLLSQ